MNVLFWNICKNSNIFNLISVIAKEEDIDILLLAEFPYTDASGRTKDYIPDMLAELKANASMGFVYNLSTKKRVEVFYNTNTTFMEGLKDEPKLSGSKVNSIGGNVKMSLVFFHLPSKVNYDSSEQSEKSVCYREAIERYEEDYQQDHLTVVCGDFNMNPFEAGMVKAQGFHAVMDESIAKQKKRTVDGDDYRFLYNPMWGFLGDTGKGSVSGTHYYRGSKDILYFWNIYDHVLMRPEAIQYFDKDALQILTAKAGAYNLLSAKGLINKAISDHLPIKFKLNI